MTGGPPSPSTTLAIASEVLTHRVARSALSSGSRDVPAPLAAGTTSRSIGSRRWTSTVSGQSVRHGVGRRADAHRTEPDEADPFDRFLPGRVHQIDIPPSTFISVPVVNTDSSLAR